MENENILVIDDQASICYLLKRIVTKAGGKVHTSESGIEALKLIDTYDFSVVLSDIKMPVLSGLTILEEIKKRDSELPVIMITGSPDMDDVKNAIKLGAYDYITKPFNNTELLLGLSRAIEYRKLVCQNRAYQKNLENMMNARTRELQLALMRLEDAFCENRKAHLESIILLSKIAEFKDIDTGNHIKRISRYTELLSKSMCMPSKFIECITYSSPMHDIGKLFIDGMILKKPSRLSPEEFEKIKLHPIYGGQILEGVPFLKMARDIALYHHENYDGSGYPYGIKHENIPLAARIAAICDVFDALVSKRTYKQEYPSETAAAIIENETGRRFDPEITKNFLKNKDIFYQIHRELKDDY